MCKKIKAKKPKFISKKMSSFGTCEAKATGCKNTISREIKIENKPEAGRQKICESPGCLKKSKDNLERKLDKTKTP